MLPARMVLQLAALYNSRLGFACPSPSPTRWRVARRLYRAPAYYAAKAGVTAAASVLNALVFAAVVYGMAGLAPAAGPLAAHLLLATAGYLVAQQAGSWVARG
jgi:hypothetical protein